MRGRSAQGIATPTLALMKQHAKRKRVVPTLTALVRALILLREETIHRARGTPAMRLVRSWIRLHAQLPTDVPKTGLIARWIWHPVLVTTVTQPPVIILPVMGVRITGRPLNARGRGHGL